MVKDKQQKSLSTLLTHGWLLENAGKKVFDRGVDYHSRKLAEIIHLADHEITADVEGSETYRVHIKVRGNALAADCDCPAMEDFGGICKHIVATALMVMNGSDATEIKGGSGKHEPTQQGQIETYLGGLAREDLIALVKERVREDRNLRRALQRRAIAANLPDKPGVLGKSFRSQITQVTSTRGFVDYWDAASVR